MKAAFLGARRLALYCTVLSLSVAISISMALAQQSDSAPTPQNTPSSVRDLVGEAETNNPEIQAAEHGWKAASQASKGAGALPDTHISAQSFSVGSPRPFAGFSNSNFAYIGFGASQDVPYPGKRKLRSVVSEREAESLRGQSESVRQQVIGDLKSAYFQLSYLQQTLAVLERNDQVLGTIEQTAESRYRVGVGNQQDVLKAQLQHTKILQEITMHHRDVGQLQASLKQLLGRPQDSPDIVTEPLSLHRLASTASDLLKRVQEQNPRVHTRAAMVSKTDAQVDLAKKEFRPDFNVQYTYERTGTSFPAYYMATLSINLPNRGKRRADLAQAMEEREQARQELSAETQRQMAEVQSQYVLAQTSAEQLKIYTEGLIPQSRTAFRSALAAYQSNQQDFAPMLSSFLDLLNLDLEYQRELAAHESALARLETLTGVILQ
jgi:outer membrane protein, heavy metal efflux system